jgi:hypothetical protein
LVRTASDDSERSLAYVLEMTHFQFVNFDGPRDNAMEAVNAVNVPFDLTRIRTRLRSISGNTGVSAIERYIVQASRGKNLARQ